LAPAWSLVWRNPVGTSLGYQARPPILLANGLNFCAKSSPVFAGWRSWPILTIPMSPLRSARFRQQHARLPSKLICLKFGKLKTSRASSRGSRTARRRLISCPIRSGDCRRGDLGYPGPAGGTLRGRLTPRFRTIAPFGDFARPVKHMRFPTQTRESPHFRAWTRAIVKPFLVGAHGLLELHATGSRA